MRHKKSFHTGMNIYPNLRIKFLHQLLQSPRFRFTKMCSTRVVIIFLLFIPIYFRVPICIHSTTILELTKIPASTFTRPFTFFMGITLITMCIKLGRIVPFRSPASILKNCNANSEGTSSRACSPKFSNTHSL